MRRLNLRNIDLNLLPVLDALLEEECVTWASRRIHLSQSATSAALNRIRGTFDDPILVRHGQRMKPTGKALRVRESLREALDRLADVVEGLAPIDPCELAGEVRISVPEYVLITLREVIRDVLARKAPLLRLKIFKPHGGSFDRELESAVCDFAIGGFGPLPTSLQRSPLYRERLVVVARSDHPIVNTARQGHTTLEAFTRYPHLMVTDGEQSEDLWISKWLAKRDIPRTVGAEIPNIGAAPAMLADSDLVCVATERCFWKVASAHSGLGYVLPPKQLGFSEYDVELVWHPRVDQDPILSWVRDTFLDGSRKYLAPETFQPGFSQQSALRSVPIRQTPVEPQCS